MMRNVNVVQDREKGVYAAGAKEHPVETEDELLQVMQVRRPLEHIYQHRAFPFKLTDSLKVGRR